MTDRHMIKVSPDEEIDERIVKECLADAGEDLRRRVASDGLVKLRLDQGREDMLDAG